MDEELKEALQVIARNQSARPFPPTIATIATGVFVGLMAWTLFTILMGAILSGL